MSVKLAPCVELSNGQKLPVIGLGTYQSLQSEVESAVKDAIDVGYRHIDTAFVYENEREIGEAIKAKIAEGIIKREDIFIVSKLGGTYHEPQRVEHGCRRSLSNLGLDYVDLYLIHFPVGLVFEDDENIHGSGKLSEVDYLDTWKAMENLVDLGLTKGIGLSNFNSLQIDRILENCRIRPLVNQVECHPAFNQKQLIQFCNERQIVIMAFSPLGRPKPDKKWPPFLFDKNARDLAKRHKRTTAQICLRYLIKLGVVVIPKSVDKKRIAENFDCFDFELKDQDIELLNSYNKDLRVVIFSNMSYHKNYPFNADF